jgi:hypothetical protein
LARPCPDRGVGALPSDEYRVVYDNVETRSPASATCRSKVRGRRMATCRVLVTKRRWDGTDSQRGATH